MQIDADSHEEASEDDYYGGPQDEAWDPDRDRAFWRRRFLILCGGVVALGLCAWLFPGAHQPSAKTVAVTRASMAALASRQALPPAAYGSAWPRPKAVTTPTVEPVTATATPTASVRPSAAKNAKKKAGSAYRPSTGASPSGGACTPGDMVLSLFTGQPSYPRGARPRFSIYVVSTSAAACTLPYGAGSVHVVVTWHGHVVWDSAACRPSPAKPIRFTLGVPQVLTMAWNPRAAEPAGCAGSLPARASGTLDAVAMTDGQSSPVRAFKLGS